MAATFDRRPSPPRCSWLAKLLPTTAAAVVVLLFGNTSNASSSDDTFPVVAYNFTVSTCARGNSESKDTVEFYTCSGGTYCDIDTNTDNAKVSARFTSAGESRELTVNVDVEPTTLVVSKPTGVDGWCVDGIKWNGGHNLLANSSLVYLDESDGDEDNCQGGTKGDSDDDSGPCMEEWRFFNLKGDPDYEYELKVRACTGESSPQVNASFCPDVTCGTTDVQLLQLTKFNAGVTTFPVQLDFNPVAMRFSASDDGWCAGAMSFNGFDLAETYPYELDAGGSRIVSNVQVYGKVSTPAPTPAPESAVAAEEDSGDGVWFEALWEIVVSVVGGIALACITGAAGVSYKRWRREQDTRDEPLPGSLSPRVPPSDDDTETEEPQAYERNTAPTFCDGLAQGRTTTP